MNDLSEKLRQNVVVPAAGEVLYAVGFSTEYVFVRAGRNVQHVVRRALDGSRELLTNLISMAFPGAAQMLRDLFGPIVVLLRGMVMLLQRVHHIRKEQGMGAAVQDAGRFIAAGVHRNIKMLPRMAMYVLPALALLVMVTIFNTTIRQPYALEVKVDGKTVGAYQLRRQRGTALYGRTYLCRCHCP